MLSSKWLKIIPLAKLPIEKQSIFCQTDHQNRTIVAVRIKTAVPDRHT